MRVIATMVFAMVWGLAHAQIPEVKEAGGPSRVVARLTWNGVGGEGGSVMFSGVREGSSVKGDLFVYGTVVSVVGTVSEAGVWSGQVTERSGKPVGEFAGALSKGELGGQYSIDAETATRLLAPAASTSGQWKVHNGDRQSRLITVGEDAGRSTLWPGRFAGVVVGGGRWNAPALVDRQRGAFDRRASEL